MTNRSPISWALRPLKRYAEFSGRSSRAEFWWFMLAIFVAYFVAYIVMGIVLVGTIGGLGASGASPGAGFIAALGTTGLVLGLFWLALIIPTIAVQVRRLHDTGRSGWWLGGFYLLYGVYGAVLIGSVASVWSAAIAGGQPTPPNPAMFGGAMVLGLLLFVYMLVLLVFYCLPGTSGDNRFGADPYGADVGEVFA